MEIKFIDHNIDEVMSLLRDYVGSISSVIDDFYEEQILCAKLFQIEIESECGGCFAVQTNEKGEHILSGFYLKEKFYGLSQPIFHKIIKEYQIQMAMVVTGDELFMSLCMDVQEKVEPHAYFFDGTIKHAVKEAEYDRSWMSELVPEDLIKYRTLTESFFGEVTDEMLEKKENYYFKLKDPASNSDPLGYGYIGVLRIRTGYGACGMITVPIERRHGVGRSIQMHLGNICREKGLIPVSGCWYYNHLSKKTIESAGRYTKTRYLDIYIDKKYQ